MQHMKRQHSLDLMCNLCSKTFKQVSNLSRHTREIHGGVKGNEKTKQCEICNVDFANSSN